MGTPSRLLVPVGRLSRFGLPRDNRHRNRVGALVAFELVLCLFTGCAGSKALEPDPAARRVPMNTPERAAFSEWLRRGDLRHLESPRLVAIPPEKGHYYGFVLEGYETNWLEIHPRDEGGYVVIAGRRSDQPQLDERRKLEGVQVGNTLAFADAPRLQFGRFPSGASALHFYREQTTGAVLVTKDPLPEDPAPANIARGYGRGVYHRWTERTSLDPGAAAWELTDVWADLTADEQEQWMRWQASSPPGRKPDSVHDDVATTWLGGWNDHPAGHLTLSVEWSSRVLVTSADRRARYRRAPPDWDGERPFELTRVDGPLLVPEGRYVALSTPSATYLVPEAFAATTPTAAQLLDAVRTRRDVFRRWPR